MTGRRKREYDGTSDEIDEPLEKVVIKENGEGDKDQGWIFRKDMIMKPSAPSNIVGEKSVVTPSQYCKYCEENSSELFVYKCDKIKLVRCKVCKSFESSCRGFCIPCSSRIFDNNCAPRLNDQNAESEYESE